MFSNEDLRIAQCLDPTAKSFATQADWNLLMSKLKAQFPQPSGDHQQPAAAAPPATPSTPASSTPSTAASSTPSTAARSASFSERRKAEMRSHRETVIVPTGGCQGSGIRSLKHELESFRMHNGAGQWTAGGTSTRRTGRVWQLWPGPCLNSLLCQSCTGAT